MNDFACLRTDPDNPDPSVHIAGIFDWFVYCLIISIGICQVEGLSKYGTNVKMDIIVRLLSITETEYYYLKALNLADSDALMRQ